MSFYKTSDLPLKKYGAWAGNPRGTPYKPGRCAESVSPPPGYISSQCSRKAVVGLFCRQHAKKRGLTGADR